MKNLIYAIILSFIAISATSQKYNPLPVNAKEKQWVDSVMARLTPRDRIAQLFMIAAYSNLDEKHTNSIKYALNTYNIGGLIFFQGSPQKQAELTNTYQATSKVPLLIAMDAEWGVGMRLKEVISFPKQMTLGAIQNDSLLYELGGEFARQFKLLGAHINFAPSVDVNNNADNPVINYRSFGENKYRVGEKGITLMRGMINNGIIPCAKHFPGHGDTDVDSHMALPVLDYSLERLDSLEMQPFKQMINNGVPMVMVGHLYLKKLEEEGSITPSSISKKVITDLLKNNLGFDGLVVSDALNMKGIKDNAGDQNVTVAALMAGQDILLMPNNVGENISAIEIAIKEGKLTQADIDQRCRKVLTLKHRAGLNSYTPVKTQNLLSKLNSASAEALNARLIESAVTLVSNNSSILPFKNIDKHKYGYIAIGGTNSGAEFSTALKLYTDVEIVGISVNPTEKEIEAASKKLDKCNVIIAGYHETSTNPSKDYGMNQQAINAVNQITKNNQKTVFVFFGSPYGLSRASNQSFDATVIAYDNNKQTQNRTAQLLFGGIPFQGKLPVSANIVYKEGDGIETAATRLKYVVPEEIGISSESLKSVDSLARHAIQNKAIPGCQIICVYKGNVFYHKAFGKHTYDRDAPSVLLSDVYDIASVTKVTATVPLIMRMIDEDRVSLDKPLKNYIALTSGSDKGGLLIRDLLLHQSGLRSWIPFYLDYLITPDGSEVFSNKKTATHSINLPDTKRYINNKYRLYNLYFSNTDNGNNRKIATNLYVSPSVEHKVFEAIDTSKILSKTYRYSDLNFLYLQRVIETVYNKPMDILLDSIFYQPMGMNNTMYNPLNRINKNRIPPTENDLIFRKELIKGHVHDQSAALFGGVAGNAGLFSNANDLAKLYAMYINGGLYGGMRYISQQTVNDFTSCVACLQGNRRGLGFDKKEPNPSKRSPISDEASLLSYGHTGFTGTMVWVDPQHDLIYVFLSNRIYPVPSNNGLSKLGTRSEIFSCFAKAVSESVKPQ